MSIHFVDLKKNYLSIKDEIDKKHQDLFINCDFINGKSVKDFETNFAKYLGVNYFIGCANGTDALELAVKSLNLNNSDEIIIQGNTYIATCLGALNNNINVVLCDICPDTHMIDISELRNKINEKTKAIIVVHLYGYVPNMTEICNICKEFNLKLIEDCAQAHGATWDGQKVGTFGDISCFSFYPGKNLGAYGDGGGIATNNSELNSIIRLNSNLGCKIKYHHEILGRNSRLDTLQASFLDVKLKYLDEWNNKRRINASIYNNKLSNVGDIKLPVIDERCVPVYHLYVIKTKYRDELQKYMEEKGVQCLIHYPISIAETNAMKPFNYDLDDVKNCIENSKNILSLPMYPELEEHEIEYICNHVKTFFLEKNLLVINSIKTDNKNGILHCINNIHFNIERYFYVNSFRDINVVRGLHANTNFNELITIIEGSIRIKLTDKNSNIVEKTLNVNDIYYVPKMNWIEYTILDINTVMLCFTDKNISESISIHNFADFIAC